MPGFTPNFSLPYQTLTDAPHGPSLGEDLAEATDAALTAMDARVDALDALTPEVGARGLKRRIERVTSSSTATTTEIGVLRGDSITCTGGRAYRFSFQGVVVSSANGDGIRARLRLQTDGNVATTSSTEVAADPVQTLTGIGVGSAALSYLHCPASTQTVSVLLSVQRSQGTGNVQIAVTNGLIQILVEDLGPAPATSGTAL